jgi:hypothetical protein
MFLFYFILSISWKLIKNNQSGLKPINFLGIFGQTKTSVVITEVIMLMVAGAGLEPATSWL